MDICAVFNGFIVLYILLFLKETQEQANDVVGWTSNSHCWGDQMIQIQATPVNSCMSNAILYVFRFCCLSARIKLNLFHIMFSPMFV